jgi:broad-specificity NMP kinase
MKILILTGPPGCGKNTVSALLAQRRSQCAVIDVDAVRQMLVQPHKAPWDGDEGIVQAKLGVENACLLARQFVQAGFDGVILDVISCDLSQPLTGKPETLTP